MSEFQEGGNIQLAKALKCAPKLGAKTPAKAQKDDAIKQFTSTTGLKWTIYNGSKLESYPGCHTSEEIILFIGSLQSGKVKWKVEWGISMKMFFVHYEEYRHETQPWKMEKQHLLELQGDLDTKCCINFEPLAKERYISFTELVNCMVCNFDESTYRELQVFSNSYNEFTVNSVIKKNNLECLKYLHNNKCYWDEHATTCAAKHGHLECLKYLHENGCPWNARAFQCAAAYNQLQCLKYLHENDCPWDELAIFEAADGHLECLKYLHENGCPWSEEATYQAAENGRLECLKYLHENGCPLNEGATHGAAENGHLECLKYLIENGCPSSEGAYAAAEQGHLECLKYLHQNGCPLNEGATYATSWAARGGHLECLKYLHQNGCPWDKDSTFEAANHNNLECLKYLVENGCPWHEEISTEIKVQIWWRMVQDLVRARPILLFWQEKTVIKVYSETGQGRKRDREDFEVFSYYEII